MDIENTCVNANLVIIGAGGGGLCAALAAAEKGITDIVVLEKTARPGGFTAMAHGFFACESPVQKREMIDCRADDCFKIHMDWAHWTRLDPLVVRAFFNKSGETVRWLEEKGLEFVLRKAYPNQMPVWHNPTGLGAGLVKALRSECEKYGVRIFTNTAATKLIKGAYGKITGVTAINRDKEEILFNAKAVILATGGFGGNVELLRKYCPAYYEGMPVPGISSHHTGDGLIMACEIGADIAETIPILVVGHGPDIAHNKVGNIAAVTGEPYTVWVNKRGKRFTDESAVMSENAALYQPGKLTYTVFDDRIRENMEERGVLTGHAPPDIERKQRNGIPGLKEELIKHANEIPEKIVTISDTWDGIAHEIGAAPESLKNTIEEYNSFCDCGCDAVFAKDPKYLLPLCRPPFYAIRCCPGFHDTMGGIKVTQNMEVRDSQDKIIPGLFTAGVLADGWESDIYCWILCGSAFGFALNSGRIAGENAAYFLSAH